jgi:hypothetical protein
LKFDVDSRSVDLPYQKIFIRWSNYSYNHFVIAYQDNYNYNSHWRLIKDRAKNENPLANWSTLISNESVYFNQADFIPIINDIGIKGGNGFGNIYNYEKAVRMKSIFPYGEDWTSTDALDAVSVLENGGFATINPYYNNALLLENNFYVPTLGTYITDDGLPHHERQRSGLYDTMKAVKLYQVKLIYIERKRDRDRDRDRELDMLILEDCSSFKKW